MSCYFEESKFFGFGLKYESEEHGKVYYSKGELRFHFDGKFIIIPHGTLTNGASIPPSLHWLFDPNDKDYRKAALVHDYLVNEFHDPYAEAVYIYQSKRGQVTIEDFIVDWDQAATIFKKAILNHPLKRFLFVWAVRIYGRYFRTK